MATVRIVCRSFVILFFVCYGSGLQVLGNFHIRNKRQLPPIPRCAWMSMTCAEKPYQYCDSGNCLEVVAKSFPVATCVPKCGLMVDTKKQPSNQIATASSLRMPTKGILPTNGNSTNVTNSTPSVEETQRAVSSTNRPSLAKTTALQVFSDGSSLGETNETETNYRSNQTVDINWRENPAFCSANFFCQNGGYCSPENLNRTSGPRSAKCICPDNWIGDFCQLNCSLNCENNGTCMIVGDDQYCHCPPEYESSDCRTEAILSLSGDASQQKKLDWFIPVLSLCTILLVTLMTYLLMTKLRWKSMVVTKVFHYFQPYEDEDGRSFDAFISYRSCNKNFAQSPDEKFVCKVLQPVLENKFSYKVCVHYRDFPPGETITNNIMWAVENSRRTILVLSPLYVESEWARLEYHKAQQEMLQMRHKIIPILFEDIANVKIEDFTLKEILSSVTYIEYPKGSDVKDTKRFWSMLQLALPKKRKLDTDTATVTLRGSDTETSRETVRNEAAARCSLESDDSLQSTRTDITEVSMETRSYRQNFPDETIIDMN